MCGCLLAGHNEHGWKVHGKLFLVGLGSARRDPKGEEYPNKGRIRYPNHGVDSRVVQKLPFLNNSG